jgi:hypothetical protein
VDPHASSPPAKAESASGFALYARFVAGVLAVAGLLALLGWWPTVRWGGEVAVRAMFGALGAASLASILGSVPLALLGRGKIDPKSAVVMLQGSMAVRFFVALVLVVVALVLELFARPPFVVWFFVGYAVLLALDVAYARRALPGSL